MLQSISHLSVNETNNAEIRERKYGICLNQRGNINTLTPENRSVTIRWLLSEEIFVAKRTTGIVRWFDGSKGYGYIDAEDGEDVFVHYLDIVDEKLPFLSQGEQVVFFLENTIVHGPQATDVTRLN